MPDDVKSVSRYEQDFAAWAHEQAAALRGARDAMLRHGSNDDVLEALDWENLAEEIEGLAQRDRRELASRIALIIEHLAKLQHSPALDPRAGWTETVGRSRRDIQGILGDSPSLRQQVPALIESYTRDAVRLAARSMTEHRELTEAAAAHLPADYTLDQVLGDWWPEPPPAVHHAAGRRSTPARTRRHD
jgi:hypothetical protein